MLLIIDNYDSFTYNIVQYFAQLGEDVCVKRNDEITCSDIEKLSPKYLVVGPGPCDPDKAGISLEAIRYFAGKIPILGICLGHQSIGAAFGGEIVLARKMMHGKLSPIFHQSEGVFKNLPNPVTCVRYHSLAINRENLPDCLYIHAWTEDGEIMGVRHKELPIEGIQFHPEALLTEHGHKMLQNFLDEFKNFQAT